MIKDEFCVCVYVWVCVCVRAYVCKNIDLVVLWVPKLMTNKTKRAETSGSENLISWPPTSRMLFRRGCQQAKPTPAVILIQQTKELLTQ